MSWHGIAFVDMSGYDGVRLTSANQPPLVVPHNGLGGGADVCSGEHEENEVRATITAEALAQIGAEIDSDVGGCGRDPQELGGNATIAVAFWGICDIKYDPRVANVQERVHVLELGDGRSSRFSSHGRKVKEAFDARYRMDEAPIKRAVLVENKKLVHDMFIREGFGHLRPHTGSYPRRYTSDLPKQIVEDLGLNSCDGGVGECRTAPAIVLKLCNRSRGAGVVVTSCEALDGVLRRLLIPPAFDALDGWLADLSKTALTPCFSDSLAEHCMHWWTNECPVFLAERCCHSIPVPLNAASAEVTYDGTLRVAFTLYRDPVDGSNCGARGHIEPFKVDFLGGYWKLPRDPVQGGGSPGISEMRNQLVSSFGSTDKRTAVVSQEHLEDVYAALAPALPQIFQSGAMGVQNIMNVYKDDNLFRAFSLSRIAASMKGTPQTTKKALGLLDLAKRMVSVPNGPLQESLPERSVLSYIERNIGVCHCTERLWSTASTAFKASLKVFPLNSPSHYLLGVCHQEEQRLPDAIECMQRAIALDPDFRSPYAALSSCYLQLGDFLTALQPCTACFTRFPDAPSVQYYAGQSLYHLLRTGQCLPLAKASGMDVYVLRGKCRRALEIAKQRVPELWTAEDERMLAWVAADEVGGDKPAEEPPRVWKLYGWRP